MAQADANPTVESELIFNNMSSEYLKTNQNGVGGWMHSAANLEMFMAAAAALAKISQKRGKTVTRVDWVRAAMVKNSKTVYIYPAEENDLDAIPVRRQRSKAWVNLISLLGPAQMTVMAGARERYPMEVLETSPVGPALALDLSRMLERRMKKERKKAAPAAAPEQPKPAPEAPQSNG